jgi:hypothetical protein
MKWMGGTSMPAWMNAGWRAESVDRPGECAFFGGHENSRIRTKSPAFGSSGAINQPPSDPPHITPGKLYETEQEHWLAWFGEYHGLAITVSREEADAKFVTTTSLSPNAAWLIRRQA